NTLRNPGFPPSHLVKSVHESANPVICWVRAWRSILAAALPVVFPGILRPPGTSCICSFCEKPQLVLAAAALALTVGGPAIGQPPERRAVQVMVFNDEGYFGTIVRDGDRFVALRIRPGEKGGPIRNFEVSGNTLKA